MSKPSLLREPLLHFLVLGMLVFAADQSFRPASDERRAIKIDSAVEDTLIGIFKDNRGREPTDEELARLFRQWLQNEVYYREALALGLDRGDEMFRSRLIMKMREVVMNNIVIPVPTEAELRGYLAQNRNRYDKPERYDFVQFVASDINAGGKQADDLLQTIGAAVPEPYADQVRVYRNRTVENIAAMFGPGFAAGLTAGQETRWRALQSNQGWHLARIEAVHPAEPATFEDAKALIRADWELAWRKAAASEALKEIRQRYTLVQAGARRVDAARLETHRPADPAKAAGPSDDASLVAPSQKWMEEPDQ
jgi:hypothetical protein